MRRTPCHPQIAYETHGDEGSPVLLIMGLATRGEVWSPQLQRLRERHRVAIFDHRGLGESARPRRAVWSMRDMADDVRRVLDALGWERAHVAGVSLGGMIAQEVALGHGSRVKSLTLIATQAGGPSGLIPTRGGVRLFVDTLLGGPDARSVGMQRLLYTPAFVERAGGSEVINAGLAARHQDPTPLRTVAAQLGAVARHDTRRRLARITAPTLVVRAGRDILIDPRRSDHLHRSIPGARLHRVDHAGHGLNYEAADELSDAMLRHFEHVDTKR